jgi:hypothetical protein
MSISPKPEQQQFIEHQIALGRFESEEAVLDKALPNLKRLRLPSLEHRSSICYTTTDWATAAGNTHTSSKSASENGEKRGERCTATVDEQSKTASNSL